MVNSTQLTPKLVGRFYSIFYKRKNDFILPSISALKPRVDFREIYKSKCPYFLLYKHSDVKHDIYNSLFFFPCGLAEYGEYNGVKCASDNPIKDIEVFIHDLPDLIKFYYKQDILLDIE